LIWLPTTVMAEAGSAAGAGAGAAPGALGGQGDGPEFGRMGTHGEPQRDRTRADRAGRDAGAADQRGHRAFGRHPAFDRVGDDAFELVIGKEDLDPRLAREFGHGGGQRLARDMKIDGGGLGGGMRCGRCGNHDAQRQNARAI